MTPTQIGILIVIVVAVVVVFSLVMQGVENQRRERRLRILTLKDQIRRAEHLLNSLPDELKTSNEEKLLIRYLISHWQELSQLEPTPGAPQNIANLTERAKNLSSGKRAATGLTLFSTREEAKSAKAVLRELAQFLADLQGAGKISLQAARPILNEVKIGYSRANLDINLFQARDMEKSRGPMVAVHQYRSCARTIAKLANFAPMDLQKQVIEKLVQDCEMRIEQERAVHEAERAAAAESEAASRSRFTDRD